MKEICALKFTTALEKTSVSLTTQIFAISSLSVQSQQNCCHITRIQQTVFGSDKRVNNQEVTQSLLGSPGDASCKESTYQAGDSGSISGSGRSPRVGNGNPLRYSCLENPMDRGAWQAIVHGQQSQTQWRAHVRAHTHTRNYYLTLLPNMYYLFQSPNCPYYLSPEYSCCSAVSAED